MTGDEADAAAAAAHAHGAARQAAATLPVAYDPPVDAALLALADGEMEVIGRMPYSSNATFLVRVIHEAMCTAAIYKPERGERPLWDFPPGLYRREIAAFELSEALGWGVIPPTVARDGPFGIGSCQLFVDAHFEQHYFTLVRDPANAADLQAICAFDLIANNTDRKSGHCLAAKWGRIYGIDQGLCFSTQSQLRTVIWDFGGERIPAALRDGTAAAMEACPERVATWLSRQEAEALVRRAEWLAAQTRFPADDGSRHWPWPLV